MFHFKPKIAKSQQPDKTPYTIFSLTPSPTPLTQRKWDEPYIQFISIDPVKKNIGNFAIRVERRFHNGLCQPLLYTKIPIARVENETLKEKEDDLLQDIGISKEKGKKKKQDTTYNLFHQISAFLAQHTNIFMSSHIMIIERQLPFNYWAVRISQHVISYFMNLFQNSPLQPVILEVDSKLKTNELGAPKGLNDRQVKQWCVEEGMRLLQVRGDQESLDILNKYKTLKKATKAQKKLDDLLDVVCQIEALCKYVGYPTTRAPVEIVVV